MSSLSTPTDPVVLLQQIADTLSALTTRLAAPARPEPLMTIDEVTAYLNVSKRSVEQLIAEGHLKPLYVLRVRRFAREAVDAFLRTSRRRAA